MLNMSRDITNRKRTRLLEEIYEISAHFTSTSIYLDIFYLFIFHSFLFFYIFIYYISSIAKSVHFLDLSLFLLVPLTSTNVRSSFLRLQLVLSACQKTIPAENEIQPNAHQLRWMICKVHLHINSMFLKNTQKKRNNNQDIKWVHPIKMTWLEDNKITTKINLRELNKRIK